MPQSSRQLNSSRKVPPISTRIGKEPSYRISLSKSTDDRPVTGPVRKVKKPWQAVFAGSPVLILVIFFHFLFAMVAAFLIVSSFAKERRRQFSEASVVANNPHKEVEHKVQMAKKKNAMTTPEIVERITTTGLSPVTLPEVAIPNINSDSPGTGKMEGVGLGGGGGGAGEPIVVDTEQLATSVFGSTDSSGGGLEGRFYDWRTASDGSATGLELNTFKTLVIDYVKKGFPNGYLKQRFYESPKRLYTNQIVIPFVRMKYIADAFHVPIEKTRCWVVEYHGKFKVPTAGTFRFVGGANYWLEVQVDGNHVLEGSWLKVLDSIRPPGQDVGFNYDFHAPAYTGSNGLYDMYFGAGPWLDLVPDKSYDIKIFIGAQSGGLDGGGCFWLQVQKKGWQYEQTLQRAPILPFFRLANTPFSAEDLAWGPPIDKSYLGWTVANPDSDN